MGTRAIIAGADGTSSSRVAVRWAAREAQRRHLPLRLVHTFEWDWHAVRSEMDADYADIVWKTADAITAAALDDAREVAPTIMIDKESVIGHPAARLLAVANDAELIVVGNRGRGGFASLLLGSVSQRVATHAPCPVVVVRGRAEATGGPVVVGVDDSPAADHVLETAFAAAHSRGSALAIVHTYLPPLPLWLRDDVPPVTVETPEQDAAERARLDEVVSPWRAKYPEVPVETMLSHDSAASVLVGVSHGAQLIVAGSRGHGTIAGAMLGSTGLQLVHHADCPVYIVRPRIV